MAVMLFEWAFTATFLILVVLALRAALGKRMSAGLRYALWAAVLVRLLVPVQLFTSPVAGTWVVTEQRVERRAAEPPITPAAPAGGALASPVTDKTPGTAPSFPDAPALPDAPEPPQPPDLTKAPAWLGWAWLAGSAAVAFVLLASNLRFFWKLRRERIPLDGGDLSLRVYVAVGLPSPCLFGLIRPAIYVTPEAAADPAMLRHVLAHEYTHYRHGDHIWSLLRCAALAAHWWNPLVWPAARLSRRDGELACDEGALKRLGDGERAGYGNTLLALVTAKPAPGDLFRCATTMAGDKKSLKERITRIVCAPKRVVWAVAAAVLVTALACVCAFGQAEPAEPSEDGDEYTPTYAVSDNGVVLVEGLGDAYVEWRGPDTSPSRGWLHFNGDPAFCCPRLAGEEVDGSALWLDEDRTGISVVFNIIRAQSDGELSPAVYVNFNVELDSGTATVTRWVAEPIGDGEALELTDREMVSMARTLAVLLTEAESYYDGLTAQPKDWNDLPAHFTADVEGVPEDVVKAAVGKAQAAYDGWRGDTSLKGTPQFDDWRIYDLAGPWEETTESARFEIWRLGYEIHTTTPERVKVTSGGALDGEGWFRPHQPDSVYLLFTLENGVRTYRTDFFSTDCGPGDSEFREILKSLGRRLADPEACPEADLNRNGVPEELRVVSIDGDTGRRLEVWENGKLLYEEEGYYAHVGYNSLFLCDLDGEDYLLRYHPTMYQGYCTYNYQLFTLENGEETVVKEGEVEFDDNFAPMMHQSFDPEAINAFMEEVNGLLSRSVQLLNTDDYLADTFEKEGRLYDSLWWLDTWEPTFVRDGSKSLLENLRDYQAAMEKEADSSLGGVYKRYLAVIQGEEPLYSPDHRERMTLDELCAETGPGYTRAGISDFSVLDLDGDGAQEVILDIDTSGYHQWCIVLHEQDGEVRGYALYIRWLNTLTLKEDGAFDWDSSAFEYGWGKLRFTETGYEIIRTIWVDADGTYYLDDRAVSQAKYDAANDRQEAVPDAEWYALNEDNIFAAFFKG